MPHASLWTQGFRSSLRILALPVLAFAIQACSPGVSGSQAPEVLQGTNASAAAIVSPVTGLIGKRIKHVVIVIQENRSLTNFFAGYPGAVAPMTGATLNNEQIALQPVTFKAPDMDHTWNGAMVDWDNGKMDGFNTAEAYSYVNRSLVAPLWNMARHYVLADHMFPTEFGPSFTAHLDLIASTANLTPDRAEVDIPDGAWRCDAVAGTRTNLISSTRTYETLAGPFPCFTQFRTMAEVLDQAHVSWRYYAPPIGHSISWSAFDAIKYVWDGPDWKNDVVNPQTKFLSDAAAGKLAGVTWVVPDFYDSDHPGSNSDTGPSWVTAIVNSIGQGPDWNSTAIVVVWDDWGGWYDSVPPPQKDFVGLGIRVPCLIISPYAKKGYVSHTQYEFGSVLKFVEQTFGLGPIGNPAFGYTDTRATSLVDSFDFTRKPSAFVKIPAKYPVSYFLHERPSMRLPDDI
jgi:phospholipase C